MSRFTRILSGISSRTWVLIGLAVLTIAVYAQTGRHPFLFYDDDLIITENPTVLKGLTWQGVSWAFTSTSGASSWHPLTWLSHMADVELFGLNAGGHHLMSAGIHALNAMVLFLVLARMTGFTWRSAFVAALFAVHPLHVESVAWAAERKDVLSTLFLLLSLWGYARYAERPGVRWYLVVSLFFGMALMSKPSVVTLPFVLLLLDWWPLSRIKDIGCMEVGAAGHFPSVTWKRILWEKVPLLMMSAGMVTVTLSYEPLSRVGNNWLKSMEELPLSMRLENAVVSCATYLWKTVFPGSLSAYYPHPASIQESIPAWEVMGAILLLIGITFIAVRQVRYRPYILIGWLWFLGTLVPMIGLVQAAAQAMADRFTYIPLIGVFIILAWGIPSLFSKYRLPQLAAGVVGGIVVLAMSVTSWTQVGYWRDNFTLFSHSVAVTEKNWFAWNSLGLAYETFGKYQEAIGCFEEALRFKLDADVRYNKGVAHSRLGQFQQAISDFRIVLNYKPNDVEAWNNLGVAYESLGRYQEAQISYREALRINPDFSDAWNNLGTVHHKLGQYEQAIGYFREALRIKPDAEVLYNLGLVYESLGQTQQGIACYREALQIQPGFSKASDRLRLINSQLGQSR